MLDISVNAEETCCHSSLEKMKLCGYLRKKRNKIAGWRKLWFVLHDRLLLSYTSKEEYDNKLVSFKDALNLVPGTQIKPLDGYRFTIETTTQTVYTFHCDDHIAYREWIAMLMDSAGSTLNCSRKFHRFVHDPMKIRNCDLLTDAERNCLRKSIFENKQIFHQNNAGSIKTSREIVRKPGISSRWNESQTLKKQIERMSISGNEDYRLASLTSDIAKHNRLELVATQNTEHSVIQQPRILATFQKEQCDNCEPVYAVVDLKNKYDQRKKRSELMEEKRCCSYESIYQMERNRIDRKEKSLESLADAIYEDGDMFFNGNSTKEIEENIYEPINVAHKSSIFEFRKYISRLNLNPFLRSTTRRTETNVKSQSNNKMSRFSTLRWKLGKHRKSVQRRMRKLYSKEYEPNPLFQYYGEKVPSGCNKAEEIPNDSDKEIDLKSGSKENSTQTESETKIPDEGKVQNCENLLT